VPYKLVGKCVYSKSGGTWHKKGCSSSPEMAKRYLAVLQMREHGVPEREKDGKK